MSKIEYRRPIQSSVFSLHLLLHLLNIRTTIHTLLDIGMNIFQVSFLMFRKEIGEIYYPNHGAERSAMDIQTSVMSNP